VEPDLDGWVAWAGKAGIHPAVIGFLRFRPTAFLEMSGNLERGWPSPRSWERVARELQLAERVHLDDAVLRLAIAGLVGAGAAHEFLAFRSWAVQIDARGMLLGEVPIEIPEAADRRYALCAALNHHVWRLPERRRAIAGLLNVGLCLSSDFAAMSLMDALRCAPEGAFAEIVEHPLFAKWQAHHGHAIGNALGVPELRSRALGDGR
jgi:hypothetical protein